MDWIEITVKTTSEGTEPVSGLILMAGIAGMVIDDPKDMAGLLTGTQAARWNYVDESLLQDLDREVEIRLYLGDHAQGRRQWADLCAGLAALKENDREGCFGSLFWHRRKVKEEDWANNWKAFFKPFTVGDRLLIKPTWETWDGSGKRTVLEIDPGSSFGTGQHHSTRMCLEFLEETIVAGGRVVDVGCGSGILMIAALLLGADFAAGVDVEENAMHTSAENLRLNGLTQDRYALYCGDIIEDQGLLAELAGEGQADLVAANIVADVIMEMAPCFSALLGHGGKLLLSGIIDDRKDEVASRFAQGGYRLLGQKVSGEWHAFLFQKG